MKKVLQILTQIYSGVVSRKVNGKGAKNTGRNEEFSNRVALSVLSSEKLRHKPQVPLILGSKNYMSKCYVDPFLRLVHQQLSRMTIIGKNTCYQILCGV